MASWEGPRSVCAPTGNVTGVAFVVEGGWWEGMWASHLPANMGGGCACAVVEVPVVLMRPLGSAAGAKGGGPSSLWDELGPSVAIGS